MEFWQKLSPAVRWGAVVGVVLIVAVLVLRFTSKPAAEYTNQRTLSGARR